MPLFYVILFVIVLIVLLAFTVALRIIFTFNSDNARMNMVLMWLNPFLRAVITNENATPTLTVYLLGKNVYKRLLKAKAPNTDRSRLQTNKMELIRRVHPKDVDVHTTYGFRDPSVTGLTCGALGIVSQFANIDSLEQNPDFATDKDYIYVDATAKLNLGLTLVNLIRSYIGNSKKHLSYQNR